MITMSEQALQALRMAVADHHTIRIPVITDRKMWIEIDQALSRIAGGSRWDRREQAHVYTQDPRPCLEQLTGSAVIPPPCVTRDKELSYWATPPALAKALINGLDLRPGSRVLEPSAGDGALIRALREVYSPLLVHITAVEPDRARMAVLQASAGPKGLQHTWDGTFEDYAAFAGPAGIRFDAVVMNPPFTLPGRRYAWAEHLLLAWDRLLPGGRLRAIVPASLRFGRQRLIAKARALVEEADGSFRPSPSGAFRGSGTDVHTLIVEAIKEPCSNETVA